MDSNKDLPILPSPSFHLQSHLLYLGPIQPQFIESKGIGLIAQNNIPPQTLILAERPYISWPRESYDSNKTIEQLQEKIKEEGSSVLDLFYPRRHDRVPGYDYPLTEKERLLCILKCNAFPSGLSLNLSYANHNCDANCQVIEDVLHEWDLDIPSHNISYPPHIFLKSAQYSNDFYSKLPPGPTYRLITTKEIKTGEEITINYLESKKPILRDERIRKLKQQYHFTCECLRCAGTLSQIGESYKCSNLSCHGQVNMKGVCDTCPMVNSSRFMDKLEIRGEKIINALNKCIDSGEDLAENGTCMDTLVKDLNSLLDKGKTIFHENHIALKYGQMALMRWKEQQSSSSSIRSISKGRKEIYELKNNEKPDSSAPSIKVIC